ncbi:MAG: T9SS type A sorting domain-containing protein [Bacteroidales bacterium]|nr:T9SS type A sorting domain-containing protein [Bacteroidales bacterium]
MKNIIYILGIIIYITIFNSYSQTIPNSSFEDWKTITYYENPDIYNFSSNIQSYITAGKANVIKTTLSHSGSYAAKLETVKQGEEVIPGMIVLGNLGSSNHSGGYPISTRPDSFKVFLNYSIQPNDTAMLWLLFKKYVEQLDSSVFIGISQAQIYDTQNDYKEFKYDINWFDEFDTNSTKLVPDSFMFIISSSNINNKMKIQGSYIYVDDLSFIGAQTDFPNGNFENWSSVSSEEPDYWNTYNVFGIIFNNKQLAASKTPDSYDGSWALRLQTDKYFLGSDSMYFGFVTNGNLFENEGKNPTGGLAINKTPDKLTFYYKYSPVGYDSAVAGLFLYKYDNINKKRIQLDSSLVTLLPAQQFTLMEIPVNYNEIDIPDTLNITFASSNVIKDDNYKGVGSVLIIDKLDLIYKEGTFTKSKISEDSHISIFPNPAKNYLTLIFDDQLSGNSTINIFNPCGDAVLSKNISHYDSAKSISLNIQNINPGIYILKITNPLYNIVKKIIIE